MKVKIKDKIYDAAKEPIMIILEGANKKNIANMLPECDKYCQYPEEFDCKIDKFMETSEVKIKLLSPLAQIPQRAKENDACYDVCAVSKKELGDGRIEYGLGFAAEIPPNTQLDLRSRSSIHKTGLILANSIGTVDEGYRGEIKAIFYHVIKSLIPYEVGDRVGQIQIKSRNDVIFKVVAELSETERGEGGFGSTGLGGEGLV